MSRLRSNQSGAGLVIAIVILLVVGTIAAVFVSLISNESFTALHQTAGLEDLGVAEGGMERAVYQYNSGTVVCAALATGAPVTLGAGSFTIAATLYNPAPFTTLSGAIVATDTTIPVVSTAGYAPHGRITIESEDIDYVAITATSFTGAMRGVNGTSPPVPHAAGKRVRQKQCLITATGTVQRPQANAQRKVEASVR